LHHEDPARATISLAHHDGRPSGEDLEAGAAIVTGRDGNPTEAARLHHRHGARLADILCRPQFGQLEFGILENLDGAVVPEGQKELRTVLRLERIALVQFELSGRRTTGRDRIPVALKCRTDKGAIALNDFDAYRAFLRGMTAIPIAGPANPRADERERQKSRAKTEPGATNLALTLGDLARAIELDGIGRRAHHDFSVGPTGATGPLLPTRLQRLNAAWVASGGDPAS
jgi:hypothetical protein